MKHLKPLTLLAFSILLISCGTAIDKFNSSPHRISLKRGDSLFTNYHDRFDNAIVDIQNDFVPREEEYLPTEYLWISKRDLQCYLDMLEELEKLNDQEITGIAIYLGAYGDDQVARNNKERDRRPGSLQDMLDDYKKGTFVAKRFIENYGDYNGRITTFLAPTFYDKTDTVTYPTALPKHKPFYIRPHDPNKRYIGEYIPIDFREEFVVSGNRNGGDTTSLLMDELNAMPPKKPGHQ